MSMIRKIGLHFTSVLLCLAALAYTSCSWGEDVDGDVVEQNYVLSSIVDSAFDPVPSTISVEFSDGFDRSQLRTISSIVPSISFYKVTASLDGTVVSLDNVTASSFSLNLYRTGIWDVSVEGYMESPEGSIFVASGSGTVTVGAAPLYGGSAFIIIAPLITAGGTGQVDLKFQVSGSTDIITADVQVYLGLKNLATGITYSGIKPYSKTDIANALVEFVTGTPASNEIQLKDANDTLVTSIPSGEYEAEFKICKANLDKKNYYRHVERLYVWDGWVTNTFFDKVSGSADRFSVDLSGTSSSIDLVNIRLREGGNEVIVLNGNTKRVDKVVSSEKGVKLYVCIKDGQSITVTCDGQNVPISSVSGNDIGYDLPEGTTSASVEIVSSNGAITGSRSVYYGSVYADGDSSYDNPIGSVAKPYKAFLAALGGVNYTGTPNTLVDVVDFKLKGNFTGGLNEAITSTDFNGKTLKFLPWDQNGFTLSKSISFQNISPIIYFSTMNMGENALVSLCSGSETHLTGPITSKATPSSPSFVVDSGAFLYLDSGFNADFSVGCKPLTLSLVADKSVSDPGKLMVSSALPSSLGGKVSIALKTADGSAATISDNVGTTVLHAAGSRLLSESDCNFFSLSDPNYFIALSSDRKTGVIRDRRATFVITQFPSQKVRLYGGASDAPDFSNMEKAKDYTLRAVVGGIEKQDVTVNYQVYQGGTAGPVGSGTINFGALGLPPDKYTLYMTYTYNGTTYSENMNFTLK